MHRSEAPPQEPPTVGPREDVQGVLHISQQFCPDPNRANTCTFAQAQEEANRITALAREKSEQMIQTESVVQSAESRADQIISQARIESEATKRETDEYIMESLNRLELELERALNQVRNGIRSIQQESTLIHHSSIEHQE